MRAQEPAQALEIERPQLYVVRPPQPRTLTVAVLRWPLAAPTLRPGLRLDELLWRPRRRLPDWLRGYLLVELPLPTSAIPTVPSPFRNGLASIPSCLAVQGVLPARRWVEQWQALTVVVRPSPASAAHYAAVAVAPRVPRA
jgi:hypothetical protein